jgi:hypothetical protein
MTLSAACWKSKMLNYYMAVKYYISTSISDYKYLETKYNIFSALNVVLYSQTQSHSTSYSPDYNLIVAYSGYEIRH